MIIKVGIEVLGIASDGDPRLLKAMKVETKIGGTSEINWFNAYEFKLECTDSETDSHTIYFQDVTHVITKLRNRLLKSSTIYPIGMLSK